MKFAKRLLVEALLGACKNSCFLLALLPSRLVIWFTSFAGSVVGRCCAKDGKISIAQLRYVFPERIAAADVFPKVDISVDQFRTLTRKAFRHVGESVGELLLWKRFTRPKDVGWNPRRARRRPRANITGSGNEIFEQIRRSGTGAVGLSAHLGSFELLAAYLAERGLKCSVLGRAPNYPSLERVIRNFRKAYGVDVIWSDAHDAARQMIAAIRDNRVICALIDQDTKWKSDFSPFFGLDAASPIAPIQLAIRHRVPLFTSFIVRASPMSHEVVTEAVPYAADDPAARSKILRTYNERLETLVRRFPEQYIWWHRRWRRRPGIDYVQSPQLLRNGSQYREWLGSLGENS